MWKCSIRLLKGVHLIPVFRAWKALTKSAAEPGHHPRRKFFWWNRHLQIIRWITVLFSWSRISILEVLRDLRYCRGISSAILTQVGWSKTLFEITEESKGKQCDCVCWWLAPSGAPDSKQAQCWRLKGDYQGFRIYSTLQWRHNGCNGVLNHQRLDCLLNRLFRRRSKKTSQLRVTGLCEENPPVTHGFPSQKASNAENVSIWWRHHETTWRVNITSSLTILSPGSEYKC